MVHRDPRRSLQIYMMHNSNYVYRQKAQANKRPRVVQHVHTRSVDVHEYELHGGTNCNVAHTSSPPGMWSAFMFTLFWNISLPKLNSFWITTILEALLKEMRACCRKLLCKMAKLLLESKNCSICEKYSKLKTGLTTKEVKYTQRTVGWLLYKNEILLTNVNQSFSAASDGQVSAVEKQSITMITACISKATFCSAVRGQVLPSQNHALPLD